MAGKPENMENSGLNALAESSEMVRRVLSFREQLGAISLKQALSEDRSVEELEELVEQFKVIAMQLRGFKEDCESTGTQKEKEVVDDVLLELKTEIMVHIAMLNEMIHTRRNAVQVGEREDDQLIRSLKRESEILQEMDQSIPLPASDAMEEITDGARVLDLGSATVRKKAEKKTEVPSLSEAEIVEEKLNELKAVHESVQEFYRAQPERGLLDKKEKLDEIAKGLTLLHIDIHFLRDVSKREKLGEAVSTFHGEVYGSLVEVEEVLRRVNLNIQLSTDCDQVDLWMQNPNLGRLVRPKDLKEGMIVYRYRDAQRKKESDTVELLSEEP